MKKFLQFLISKLDYLKCEKHLTLQPNNLVLITLIIIFSTTSSIVGQNSSSDENVPNIQTPNAAAFSQYGNVPVSEYTGVPNISIPLYTIKEDGLEIPIVLRYHASGIKVDQEASWVGLGWLLDVGGVINEQVKGFNEGLSSYASLGDNHIFHLNNRVVKNMYVQLNRIFVAKEYLGGENHGVLPREALEMGLMDDQKTQPDVFQYNFMGYSGKYIVDPGQFDVSLTSVGQPVIQHNKDLLKVSHSPGYPIIYDAMANEYHFSQPELTETDKHEAQFKIFTNANHLKKIVSSKNNKEVLFKYFNDDLSKQTKMFPRIFQYTGLVETPKVDFFSKPAPTFFDVLKASGYRMTINNIPLETIAKPVTLEEIETDKVRIEFILGNRLDIEGEAAKKLDRIDIYDKKTNTKIKSYVFDYSYFNGDAASYQIGDFYDDFNLNTLKFRLKLDSVTEINYKNDVPFTKPAHTFTYEENIKLPLKSSTAKDHWGYYNGVTDNLILNPNLHSINGFFHGYYNFGNITTAGADRGADENSMKAAILKEITYPTGGKSKFYYEPHTFSNHSVFSKEEIYESEHTDVYKGTVATDNTGTPELFFAKAGSNLTITARLDCDEPYNQNCGNYSFARNSWVQVRDGNGILVFGEIEWPQNSDWGLNNQVTKTFRVKQDTTYEIYYNFIYDDSNFTSTNPHLRLSLTKEKQLEKEESVGGGLRISKIEDLPNDIDKNIQTFEYNTTDNKTSGKLITPLRYHRYKTLKRACNNPLRPDEQGPCYIDWADTNPSCLSIELGLGRSIVASGEFGTSSFTMPKSSPVGYDRVTIRNEDESGNSNGSTIKYFRNEAEVDYENYHADLEEHFFNGTLERVEIKDADEILLETKIFNQNEAEEMICTGIQYKLEEQVNMCTNFINHFRFYFQPFYRYKVTDSSVETTFFNDGNPSLTTLEESNYNDLGQLISKETTGSNGKNNKVIYHYPYDLDESSMVNSNFLAPVMLTENFIDTIKTKSVKTDYISSLINSNYYIPTTKYYSFKNDSFKKEMSYSFYDDTNNIKEIERIDDTSSLSSVFYIWGYNNEYPIAKIDNFTSTEADAIQSLIDDAIDASNLDDDNQTSNPTGKEKALKDALNIIRNHSSLNKSQMSSYTYDPLVGITSMTDPRGYTVYYEYDEFNRLKQVKDAEGNILSKNEYNYKN